MDISNTNLKKKLGKIAILEGANDIDEMGYLKDIIEALQINENLILTNIYKDHEKLKLLPSNKVQTILLETTWTYQNKIFDVAKFLIGLYKATKWKPKYIVNTMDYGLEALWYICSKLEIEVYKIEDANRISDFEFALKKFEPKDDFEAVKIAMEYDWFDQLFKDGI
jgi:hypothetical protein